MCMGTNCQVTFARKTGVNFQPLWCFCVHVYLRTDVLSQQKTKRVVYCSVCPVYMMLRLFFKVDNGTCLWWILRMFCFSWLELFSRCSSSFLTGLKVLFPRDLKVSHFQSSNIVSHWEEDIQRMLSQNIFTTLFCQLSQPNLKQHRLAPTSQRNQPWLAAGWHQECSRETEWGESVFPDPRLSSFLAAFRSASTWEMKALRGTSFPGRAQFSVRVQRTPSATCNALTALLSSVM